MRKTVGPEMMDMLKPILIPMGRKCGLCVLGVNVVVVISGTVSGWVAGFTIVAMKAVR